MGNNINKITPEDKNTSTNNFFTFKNGDPYITSKIQPLNKESNKEINNDETTDYISSKFYQEEPTNDKDRNLYSRNKMQPLNKKDENEKSMSLLEYITNKFYQ